MGMGSKYPSARADRLALQRAHVARQQAPLTHEQRRARLEDEVEDVVRQTLAMAKAGRFCLAHVREVTGCSSWIANRAVRRLFSDGRIVRDGKEPSPYGYVRGRWFYALPREARS